MRQVEFDHYIAPDGKVYNFHNLDDRFLMSFEGMGMPTVEYIEQQGPFQHGVSLLDYRLQKRIIQYVHRRNTCDRQTLWETRWDILDALRPNRQVLNSFALGKLRKRLPGGYLRDIDVSIENGPTFGARDLESWDEFGFTETIRFIAPDPTFYDPTLRTATWSISITNRLVFPETFPFLFESSVIDNDIAITYPGTWLSFPTIVITGPMKGPIITNETTGEKIHLQYDISSGETVTINLAFGNKTVVNNHNVNLIGLISTDSDTTTFHIAPDPEAAGGINTFNVVAGGGLAGVSSVVMTYYDRYIGI